MTTMITITPVPLGTQLGAMIGYANLISGEPKVSTLVESWAKVEEAVMVPFGIESGDPPNSATVATEYFESKRDVFRAKLDRKIGRIFDNQVTAKIVEKEEIDVDQMKTAINMNLISMMPARALIQSALMVRASGTSTKAAKAMAMFPLLLGAAKAGWNFAHIGQPIYENFIGGVAVPFGIGVFATIFFSWMVSNPADIAAERFKKMF